MRKVKEAAIWKTECPENTFYGEHKLENRIHTANMVGLFTINAHLLIQDIFYFKDIMPTTEGEHKNFHLGTTDQIKVKIWSLKLQQIHIRTHMYTQMIALIENNLKK